MTPPPPGTISFGGGIPDPATLPLPGLAAAALRVLAEDGVAALQYGGSLGDDGLREQLAARYGLRYGVKLSPDQVMITTGSSQALDALCAVLVDPGDAVLTEDPAFTGSLWTFRAHGARLVPVPVDDAGLDVAVLEERLRVLRRDGVQPKLIYTTPDFQNPTSVNLTFRRRLRLVELAEEFGCVVVEDTAYEEVRIDGTPVPSLLSLAPERVVQMGTFSKTVGPGLRTGWLLGAPQAVEHAARGRTDMGSTITLSKVMAGFLADGALDPHLERMRRVYQAKRDAMVQALGETVGGYADWAVPEGGFFLWLRLRGGLDPAKLQPLAWEERVSFVPGYRFLVEERPLPALRLAFSQVSLEEIPEGIRRLGRALERLGSAR